MNQKQQQNIRKCRFKFAGRKCNSKQKWNIGKCHCKCKYPRKRV